MAGIMPVSHSIQPSDGQDMTTDNFLIQNLLIVLKKIYTFALSFSPNPPQRTVLGLVNRRLPAGKMIVTTGF